MATDNADNDTRTDMLCRNFSPEQDARVLVGNLRHFGGQNRVIVELVSSRNRSERLEIAKSYRKITNKELIDDIKLYTHFDFQRVLVGCFTPPIQYDAMCLRQALEEFGMDKKSLVELLTCRTNSQIREIRDVYRRTYDHDLDALIRRKTSGEFCDLLLMLAEPSRDETDEVNADLVKRDAKALSRAIRKGSAVQNYTFSEIFCQKNFAYLRETFSAYEKMTSRSIHHDIRIEFSGEMKAAFKTIAGYANNATEFFAHRLYKSMKGLGTDDSTLTRIIVTRSEIDMSEIKKTFQEKYGSKLERFIVGDTSFSYKNILLSLVSELDVACDKKS